MQRLVEALAASLDPVSLVRRAVEQMCLYNPSATGASIAICDPASPDDLIFVAAHGAVASLLGHVVARSESFQEIALRSRSTEIVHDICTDSRVGAETRARAAALDIRSWIVTPLLHNDTAIGAMSVVAREKAAFDATARAAITSLSNFVAALMSSQAELTRLFDALHTQQEGEPNATSFETAKFVAALLYPEKIEDDAAHRRLDDLFAPGALQPVFQPIVDLQTRCVLGYEGLSRFPGAPERTTLEWFHTALQAGRAVELEMHAAAEIITASRHIPEDLSVAVNLSPGTVADPGAQDILLAANRSLTVELTEHEPFPSMLVGTLAPLRSAGVAIAVDDAGAGYASFLQVMRLRPDVIKIDAEFTAGVEADPARRVLTSAIVELAREIGAVTVAEAIETEDQLRALGQLGVLRGQGYHLGRPRCARGRMVVPSRVQEPRSN